MSDAKQEGDSFYGLPIETDMDRMVERAIASLVERGKMTPEEAAVKRAELRQSQDVAGERTDPRQAADEARIDEE